MNDPARFSALPSAREPAAAQPRPTPREDAPQFVYLAGAFHKPGRYAWTNGMTLKDGIEAAGGFTQYPDRRLRLVHQNHSVEILRLGRGGTLMNNPALLPADLIYVRDMLEPLW